LCEFKSILKEAIEVITVGNQTAAKFTESPTTRRAGGLDFFRHRREKTKARQCLNRCKFHGVTVDACELVQSTRFENTQSEKRAVHQNGPVCP
jgi:hypothetical protein